MSEEEQDYGPYDPEMVPGLTDENWMDDLTEEKIIRYNYLNIPAEHLRELLTCIGDGTLHSGCPDKCEEKDFCKKIWETVYSLRTKEVARRRREAKGDD